ncbi:MAG: endo alpha-1,4 polygalactosaminidase [Coriobacteriales bacterium]|nr:endo alpha-1,4 polygalactosaminidase [Coriobacteriales bacterium]
MAKSYRTSRNNRAHKLVTAFLAAALVFTGAGTGLVGVPFFDSKPAYGATAPTVSDFTNAPGNKAGRYQFAKNARGQAVVSYTGKNGWEGVSATVSNYSRDYSQLSLTLALQGTKQVGIELVIPGKPKQVVRYADLALSKQSVVNADGSYTFDISIDGYADVQSKGVSSIIIYLDPTAKVSGTRSATIIDVSFRMPGQQPALPDAPDQGSSASIAGIASYACYYGNSSALEKLKGYDLAIIDFKAIGGAKSVADLKQAGVTVIAYVTLGEEDLPPGVKPTQTGGDWYIPHAANALKNSEWGSYYVDAGNPRWQAKILNEAEQLLDAGVDGFFFDTVDTVANERVLKYRDTRAGMVDLIKKLDAAYPGAIKVVNRGFSILEDVVENIDGVMFEEFSTTTSYKKWSKDDLAWTSSTGAWLQDLASRHGLTVLALDYASSKSSSLVSYASARARDYGFVSYMATRDLDKIL